MSSTTLRRQSGYHERFQHAPMTNDLRRPEISPREPEAEHRVAPERSAYLSLIQDLVRFRQFVLERLTTIEQLAVKRAASGSGATDRAAMEEALQKRSDELEAIRRELEDQAEREKRDWNASVAQIEEDRSLLAEAWERVEQARIETLSTPRTNHSLHSPGPNPQTPGSPAWSRAGASAPIRPNKTESNADNPIDQSIQLQFQTLYDDVRQSAGRRRPAR
jgi:hypothetical protein